MNILLYQIIGLSNQIRFKVTKVLMVKQLEKIKLHFKGNGLNFYHSIEFTLNDIVKNLSIQVHL